MLLSSHWKLQLPFGLRLILLASTTAGKLAANEITAGCAKCKWQQRNWFSTLWEWARTHTGTHAHTYTHQAHLVSQAKPLSISQVLGLIKLKTGCRCTSVGVCVQWRVRNSPCVHWCKAKCVCTCAFSYMCMCVCMTAPSSRSLLVQH